VFDADLRVLSTASALEESVNPGNSR
jgi:hypothetical protein